MAVDRYEEQWVDVAEERLVALPARLETTWFSPVTTTVIQGALAVNGLNVGGNQIATAVNMANTTVVVS